MEIKNTLLKQFDPYRAKLDGKSDAALSRARDQGETAQGATVQGDKVSLSSSARLHTLAHTVAVKTPELRQDKVEAIKERLSAGEYTIDSKDIARKLLESDALLAGTLGHQ